ncbi:MAG: sulfite exporter TauE/SafE family protein [Phycisphaerales bacterium]|nr:sulfite exporter TauE/SafE family protein [Phycisphaerales bacterium]
MIDTVEILILLALGLLAGTVGGLLGVGGSIVMIPALVVVFGGRDWGTQHLFQASAMVVNVAVALPASIRHRQKGAVDKRLFRIMLPVTMVFIIVGVLVSDRLEGQVLQRLFAVFLVYVAGVNLHRLTRPRRAAAAESAARVTLVRGGICGVVMGFMAGLLGIGGGGVAVPLIQMVCRLPLRTCIAVSANVMCITAAVGAITKMSSLHLHDADWRRALTLSLLLAPTAVLGGFIGAGLTHRLPVRVVRTIFVVVVLITAAKMGGLLG